MFVKEHVVVLVTTECGSCNIKIVLGSRMVYIGHLKGNVDREMAAFVVTVSVFEDRKGSKGDLRVVTICNSTLSVAKIIAAVVE
jgi:hypothetical protein